jgi:hypothetical protein
MPGTSDHLGGMPLGRAIKQHEWSTALMVTQKQDPQAEIERSLPTPALVRYTDEDLRRMRDFDAVLAELQESELPVLLSGEHIGSGSELLSDKRKLVDTKFLALSWQFHESDDYSDADGPIRFVSVHVLTENGDRFVFNDGTKGGVRDQLMELSIKSERFEMLLCEKGLRISEYEYEDEHTGSKSQATSYYIA